MRTRHLAIGPHTLAVHESGDGAPVVLLHSSGFSSRQWRRLAEALAPSYRVVLPDLLGSGASSPWPDGEPFELGQDVAAVVALLDELPPAHLVGHSYGGLLALLAALRRPAAVRSLAVYEPVAFGALDAPADRPLRAEVTAVTGAYDGEPWLRGFVEWWNGPGAWAGLAPEARQAFLDVGWKLSQEVISLVADRTPLATYATIAAPALFLGGDRTPLAERTVVERLAGALPHAERVRFPDAGHMGPITHAAAVNAAIVAFLTRVNAAV